MIATPAVEKGLGCGSAVASDLNYGAPFVSKLIFSLVINFSSFSVLNHGFKRLKSERRTP